MPTLSAGCSSRAFVAGGWGTTTSGGAADAGGTVIVLAAEARGSAGSCLQPKVAATVKAPRNTSNSPVLIARDSSAVRPSLEPHVGNRTHFCAALSGVGHVLPSH